MATIKTLPGVLPLISKQLNQCIRKTSVFLRLVHASEQVSLLAIVFKGQSDNCNTTAAADGIVLKCSSHLFRMMSTSAFKRGMTWILLYGSILDKLYSRLESTLTLYASMSLGKIRCESAASVCAHKREQIYPTAAFIPLPCAEGTAQTPYLAAYILLAPSPQSVWLPRRKNSFWQGVYSNIDEFVSKPMVHSVYRTLVDLYGEINRKTGGAVSKSLLTKNDRMPWWSWWLHMTAKGRKCTGKQGWFVRQLENGYSTTLCIATSESPTNSKNSSSYGTVSRLANS